MRITFNNVSVPTTIPRAPVADLFGELRKDVVPVFSGKSALSLLLRHYRSTGDLENKSSEVLVPSWMGSWVTMTMQKQCFPTTTFNVRTRGLLLYHQWGFPQRVDKILRFARKHGLFVIEDCAHAFESRLDGQRLGTFGDAAIFSLAKFFPCVVGGAVYSADPAIRRSVKAEIPSRPTAFEKSVFARRKRFDRRPTEANHIELERDYGVYDRLLACDPRALSVSAACLARGALTKRWLNAERLRQEFDPRDRFDLWQDDVVPWIVPLFFGKEALRRAAAALGRAGVESGVYRFDVNRDMLDPDWRECLAVPCHDGISERQMETIIGIIRTHHA